VCAGSRVEGMGGEREVCFALPRPRLTSMPASTNTKTQRFAAVIMRIRDPKTTALIFASGKMVRGRGGGGGRRGWRERRPVFYCLRTGSPDLPASLRDKRLTPTTRHRHHHQVVTGAKSEDAARHAARRVSVCKFWGV
jgi:hypothetical protein